MKSHPAQANNLHSADVDVMLGEAAITIEAVREIISYETPTKAKRDQMRRQLAGVVAKVEIIRAALDR